LPSEAHSSFFSVAIPPPATLCKENDKDYLHFFNGFTIYVA